MEGTALLFECGELRRRSIVTPVAAVPHTHTWLPLLPRHRVKIRRTLPNSSQRQCQLVSAHVFVCASACDI